MANIKDPRENINIQVRYRILNEQLIQTPLKITNTGCFDISTISFGKEFHSSCMVVLSLGSPLLTARFTAYSLERSEYYCNVEEY